MFGSHRETTDFLALAVSLIIVLRTFIAEPFQIPTGSMGPTFLGRHKEPTCPACGYQFAVSTSDEWDHGTGQSRAARALLTTAECPNCRATVSLENVPTQAGDRILVWKNPAAGFRRFDVAVFKRADERQTPFLKRLVGLPGETIRINRGEIEILGPGRDGAAEWQICRKSPAQVLQMAVLVHDDRFAPRDLPADWPPRWSATPATWCRDRTGHVLERKDDSGSLARLEYRHIGRTRPRPRLITDDLAYNSALTATESGQRQYRRASTGHPVGDLIVEFGLSPSSATRRFGVELILGHHVDRWLMSKADEGGALHSLERDGRVLWSGAAPFPSGPTSFRFARVDRRLLLWDTDGLVASVELAEESGPNLDATSPQERDLVPVVILADGVGTRVSDLVLSRDIYYSRRSESADFFRPAASAEEMDEFLADPARWARLREITPQSDPWILGDDEYIALGDNSLQSNDSRHWHGEPFVRRRMLLGRAQWLLWPLTTGRFGPIP